MEENIPRIIHYVWLGAGKKSELMQKCIDSWKKFCQGYEIIEWNETNFDINSNPIVAEAIKQKNWALASDGIRMYAMYNCGGIYMDTDVEVIKSLDPLLTNQIFLGFESKYWLESAMFGAVKGHPLLSKCIEHYNMALDINFSTNALTVHTYAAVAKKMLGAKLNGKTQFLENGATVYSTEYFAPKNYMSGKLKLTENSFVIHHYTSTWHSKSQKFWAGFAKNSRIILGKHIFSIFEKIVGSRYLATINRDFKKKEKLDAKNNLLKAQEIVSIDENKIGENTKKNNE